MSTAAANRTTTHNDQTTPAQATTCFRKRIAGRELHSRPPDQGIWNDCSRAMVSSADAHHHASRKIARKTMDAYLGKLYLLSTRDSRTDRRLVDTTQWQMSKELDTSERHVQAMEALATKWGVIRRLSDPRRGFATRLELLPGGLSWRAARDLYPVTAAAAAAVVSIEDRSTLPPTTPPATTPPAATTTPAISFFSRSAVAVATIRSFLRSAVAVAAISSPDRAVRMTGPAGPPLGVRERSCTTTTTTARARRAPPSATQLRFASDLGVDVSDLDGPQTFKVIQIAQIERITADRTATAARIEDIKQTVGARQGRGSPGASERGACRRGRRPEDDLTPTQRRNVRMLHSWGRCESGCFVCREAESE